MALALQGRPRLIVLCGPPCSGKSTLAGQLAMRLGITHLQMGQVRERLMPASSHGRRHIDIAYRAMHWTAECCCVSLMM